MWAVWDRRWLTNRPAFGIQRRNSSSTVRTSESMRALPVRPQHAASTLKTTRILKKRDFKIHTCVPILFWACDALAFYPRGKSDGVVVVAGCPTQKDTGMHIPRTSASDATAWSVRRGICSLPARYALRPNPNPASAFVTLPVALSWSVRRWCWIGTGPYSLSCRKNPSKRRDVWVWCGCARDEAVGKAAHHSVRQHT
jgi:hypothetical protein